MGTQSVGKNLAMLCHLVGLTGFIIPFGHILGPLIVWMIGKSDSPSPLFFIVCVFLMLFIGPIAVVHRQTFLHLPPGSTLSVDIPERIVLSAAYL
jgi:hypothetical protein